MNFDPLIVRLLREVKYFLLLGLRVPESALEVYGRGEVRYRSVSVQPSSDLREGTTLGWVLYVVGMASRPQVWMYVRFGLGGRKMGHHLRPAGISIGVC